VTPREKTARFSPFLFFVPLASVFPPPPVLVFIASRRACTMSSIRRREFNFIVTQPQELPPLDSTLGLVRVALHFSATSGLVYAQFQEPFLARYTGVGLWLKPFSLRLPKLIPRRSLDLFYLFRMARSVRMRYLPFRQL